jgi:DNA-binding MarR family transcriptional regulator
LQDLTPEQLAQYLHLRILQCLLSAGGLELAKNDLYPIASEVLLYSALLLKFSNGALEERLRACGERISSLQHGILRMLQYETLTISEISQRLGLDPSTVVRSVDALERRVLARRGSDPQDRRRNPITITERGVELVTTIPAISAEDLSFQALQSLGIGGATQLRDLLRRLISEFPEGKMVAELVSGQMDKP